MASPIYVALYTLLLLLLALRVIIRRREVGIALGSGDDEELLNRRSAHTNASQYLPMAALLLVALELAGASASWVHFYGFLVLVGRTLHGIALSKDSLPMREVGMHITLWPMIALALHSLVLSLAL